VANKATVPSTMDVFEVRKIILAGEYRTPWKIMNGYGVVFLSVTYLGLVSSEINSTNSLCLHVTAFANSCGNIAIVTSAFSPETENSSS